MPICNAGLGGDRAADPDTFTARLLYPRRSEGSATHVALALVVVALVHFKGVEGAAWSVLWSHAVTGLALLVSLPWWRRHFISVVILLVLDHVATFAGGGVVALFYP